MEHELPPEEAEDAPAEREPRELEDSGDYPPASERVEGDRESAE